MSDDISVEKVLSMPEMADVLTELNDPRFGGRKHGTRRVRAEGCSGPLCRKVERDHSREYYARVRSARQGRTPRGPNLKKRMYDRDDLLAALINWHHMDVALRKATKGSERITKWPLMLPRSQEETQAS